MLHYANVNTPDMDRSAAFYNALLSPLGWRRHSESETSIAWGMNVPAFYITKEDSARPGYGLISFPAKSIPAVRASFEQGVGAGGESVAEPGSAPMHGPGNYAARLKDPDGYLVEICVSNP
jgi:catechol 2,3-dioxygenase-like lactoylglutathione lyase family enzyme